MLAEVGVGDDAGLHCSKKRWTLFRTRKGVLMVIEISDAASLGWPQCPPPGRQGYM